MDTEAGERGNRSEDEVEVASGYGSSRLLSWLRSRPETLGVTARRGGPLFEGNMAKPLLTAEAILTGLEDTAENIENVLP